MKKQIYLLIMLFLFVSTSSVFAGRWSQVPCWKIYGNDFCKLYKYKVVAVEREEIEPLEKLEAKQIQLEVPKPDMELRISKKKENEVKREDIKPLEKLEPKIALITVEKVEPELILPEAKSEEAKEEQDLQAQIDELKARVAELEEQNKDNEEGDEATDDSEQLLAVIADLETRLTALEERVTELEVDNKSLEQQLAEKAQEIQDVKDEIAKLREEKPEGFEDVILELEKLILCFEEEYYEIEANIMEVNKTYEELLAEIQTLEVNNVENSDNSVTNNTTITEDTVTAEETTITADETTIATEENDDCDGNCDADEDEEEEIPGHPYAGMLMTLKQGIEATMASMQVFQTWMQYELMKQFLVPSPLYMNLGQVNNSVQGDVTNNGAINYIQSPMALLNSVGTLTNYGSINNDYSSNTHKNYYMTDNSSNTANKSFAGIDSRDWSTPATATANNNNSGYDLALPDRQGFNFSGAIEKSDVFNSGGGSWMGNIDVEG